MIDLRFSAEDMTVWRLWRMAEWKEMGTSRRGGKWRGNKMAIELSSSQ